MCAYNFLVNGQRSPNFFAQRGMVVVNHLLSLFFYISIHSGDIRGQNLKLSEIAPNSARFLPSQFFGGFAPQNFYQNVYLCLTAHHLAKFHKLTLTGPKVIGPHTLNFNPIFECSCKKLLGTPVPGRVCVSRPWSFSLSLV